MANEGTTTTLAATIRPAVLNKLLVPTKIDNFVTIPLCFFVDMTGEEHGTQHKVGTFTKDATADITEGTPMSNTQPDSTAVTSTVGLVGIAYDLSDLAAGSGPINVQTLAAEAQRYCYENLEDDLCALFASFSQSVGSTGVDISVANFLSAKARLRVQKATGKPVSVLHTTQATDLEAAIVASSAQYFGTPMGDGGILRSGLDGYFGNPFNVDTWYSNLPDTINAGADVAGAMFVDHGNSLLPGGLAFGVKWWPRAKYQDDAKNTSTIIGVSFAYFVSEFSDTDGVLIGTDA